MRIFFANCEIGRGPIFGFSLLQMKLCGTLIGDKVFTTLSDLVNVQFYVDTSGVAKGWKLQIYYPNV